MNDSETRESIQAVFPLVILFDASWRARVPDNLKHFGAPDYGHLILTTERLAYVRSFKSKKVREGATGPLGHSLVTEGWEQYRPDDLLEDLRDHSNRDIPLATIQSVSTSGRNDVWLELQVATLRRTRRFRAAHIVGAPPFASSFTPWGVGGSMVPVADDIRRVQRGVAPETPLTHEHFRERLLRDTRAVYIRGDPDCDPAPVAVGQRNVGLLKVAELSAAVRALREGPAREALDVVIPAWIRRERLRLVALLLSVFYVDELFGDWDGPVRRLLEHPGGNSCYRSRSSRMSARSRRSS